MRDSTLFNQMWFWTWKPRWSTSIGPTAEELAFLVPIADPPFRSTIARRRGLGVTWIAGRW
jgi:hypothetical protein